MAIGILTVGFTPVAPVVPVPPAPERATDRAVPVDPVSALPRTAVCRCGHDRAAHRHYRPGHDCGACGAQRCGRFTARSRRSVLLGRLRGLVRENRTGA